MRGAVRQTLGRKHFGTSPTFLRAAVAFFLASTGHQLFLMYPLKLQQLGKNQTEIGVLTGASALAAFLARPALGRMIDNRGRRPIILMGAAAMTGAALLFLLPVTNNPVLLLFRLIQGVAYAAFFTACFTWAADYTPPERLAEGIGLFGVAGLLAGALGPLLGERILASFGPWFTPFVMAASILIIVGGALWLSVKESTRPAPSIVDFWTLARRVDLLTVTISSLLFGAVAGTVTSFIAPYGKESGLTFVSDFFTAYCGVAIFVRLFGSSLPDRVGRARVIAPALLLYASGVGLLSLPIWTSVIAPIGVIVGLAHGVVYPAMNALMIERAGADQRGTASALFSGAVDLGYFVGPTLFGVIARVTGYRPMFALCCSCVAAGVILLELVERLRPGFCQPHPR